MHINNSGIADKINIFIIIIIIIFSQKLLSVLTSIVNNSTTTSLKLSWRACSSLEKKTTTNQPNKKPVLATVQFFDKKPYTVYM